MMHPLPPLKIQYVNPEARLVPAVVISAECGRNTIRIQLRRI